MSFLFNLQDEKLEDSWSLLTESDLISVFDQFPFADLLIHLLNMETVEGKKRGCESFFAFNM